MTMQTRLKKKLFFSEINKFGCCAVLLCLASSLHADPLSMNQRDIALQSCLNINYEALGAYKSSDLKDFSGITLDMKNIDQIMKLRAFVKQETGHFFKENIPVKAEGMTPPFNAIFLRCTQFIKSKKLAKFIHHHKMEP